jgi:trans-aconitate 2-methyltransferase
MFIKFFALFLCASLFSAEGITQASAYRACSHYQWQTAIDSLNDFPFERGDQVLDVGCGDGKVTAVVSDRVPEGAVVGIDISEAMITEAASRFHQNNLTFLQGNATAIPFKDRFDKVVSFNAMHWVLEQKTALESIFSSLKNGGKALLQFPAHRPNNFGVLAAKMALTEKWAPYFPNFRPIRSYHTLEQYESLLKEVGFQVETITAIENASNFQDKASFVVWMTPLINFIDHLPQPLQKEYLEELCDEMLLIDPLGEDGSVSIRLVQLRAIAVKKLSL